MPIPLYKCNMFNTSLFKAESLAASAGAQFKCRQIFHF
jgi:hypothetical protein